MPQYQWLTLAQALAALAGRLADPNNIFWTQPELLLYLQEALRTFNALTGQWNADFSFTSNPSLTWYNVATMSGSPRLRTITDAYLYQVMQYMLLEPPTGAGLWTGTSQFSLADLQYALQHRRDEVIQVAGCNLAQLPPLASTPNSRRTYFPDSTLEPRRARFLYDESESAVTLNREDTLVFDAFEPGHLQNPAIPQSWSVITGPPLAFDVDTAPNVAGAYDVISLQAGLQFAPPAATLLGVPDDFSWVPKLGALADLLGRESEATDIPRAQYCMARYADALKLMKDSNWLVSATINNYPCDTPSMFEMDWSSPEWENNDILWPTLVQAGVDFVAPAPVSSILGVGMIVVGNAPVPVNPTDFVQISRDQWDSVLSYAQFLAMLKQGGAEFKDGLSLEKEFLTAAAYTNKRIGDLGLYRDVLGQVGEKQDLEQSRD